jgi:phosphate transport system substrate-binding protein
MPHSPIYLGYIQRKLTPIKNLILGIYHPSFKGFLFILIVLFGTISDQESSAHSSLRIVGSTALYPAMISLSEHYGYMEQKPPPIVEATGTGGGIQLFCQGSHHATPSIVAASRPLTAQERRRCALHGVNEPLEIVLGYDGIIVGVRPDFPIKDLSLEDVDRLLSYSWKGKENPHTHWHQINPKYPSMPLHILGPARTSGTYQALEEILKSRRLDHGGIRDDGIYRQASDQENVVVQKLLVQNNTIGIFSYGFLQENEGLIRGMSIGGISPTALNIRHGRYPLSRRLYVYVKREHLTKIPGLKSFVTHMIHPDGTGLDGYLSSEGFIPLSHENFIGQRAYIETFLGKIP